MSTQCHFFAGIGGWIKALEMSNMPDDIRLITGSCPCQSFSQAGARKGKDDERHLAPKFLELINEFKPMFVFGEQVSAAIEYEWLDDLQNELENQNFAVGASVLSASLVGAPHKRERLYFGAVSTLVDSYSNEYFGKESRSYGKTIRTAIEDRKKVIESGKLSGASDDVLRFWDSGREYLCRDGKYRIIEPTIPLLADGISSTMGRLRGYGNAIVPQLGAHFINTFLESYLELT